MPAMADLRDQAVTGMSPPQVNEAIIRDVWPSVAAYPAAANFARAAYRQAGGARRIGLKERQCARLYAQYQRHRLNQTPGGISYKRNVLDVTTPSSTTLVQINCSKGGSL